MAVTLIVEDGTGRSDANAIVSLEWLKAYFDGRGVSYAAYTDDVLNAAIVRASAFLVAAYLWQGQKVNMRAQTMPFPRFGVTDREGWIVLQNEIPREVKDACCEIALFEAATPGAMNPSVVQSEKVRSEQVGSIRVEYANLFNSAADTRPVLLAVNDLLWPFLSSGAGQYLSGRADRV